MFPFMEKTTLFTYLYYKCTVTFKNKRHLIIHIYLIHFRFAGFSRILQRYLRLLHGYLRNDSTLRHIRGDQAGNDGPSGARAPRQGRLRLSRIYAGRRHLKDGRFVRGVPARGGANASTRRGLQVQTILADVGARLQGGRD